MEEEGRTVKGFYLVTVRHDRKCFRVLLFKSEIKKEILYYTQAGRKSSIGNKHQAWRKSLIRIKHQAWRKSLIRNKHQAWRKSLIRIKHQSWRKSLIRIKHQAWMKSLHVIVQEEKYGSHVMTACKVLRNRNHIVQRNNVPRRKPCYMERCSQT